ncbi:glycosyltransferase family 4 protein [Sphingomonas sp. CJ99]
MIRVGFVIADRSTGWLGGLNYRRNLISAILSVPDRRIEPVLMVPPDQPPEMLAGFPAVEVVRTPLADPQSVMRKAGKVSRRLIGRDLALERLMTAHRIDLLSHSGTLGPASRWPSLNWIPDFQHVRMPQFFSPAECADRDGQFRRLIDGSRRILVSSADAGGDLLRFAPDAADKVSVLHFVSGFESAGPVVPVAELQQRFGFDEPYYHLPNQFWAHKNHALVIEALGILATRGPVPLVLCTGKTEDSRNPDHFPRLMARAAELGVADRFRPLGIVSLAELGSLMLGARALINPSNFEGWSTTVEESKSLGLPIILSDIPVHLEQAPPHGRFFQADSAESLADAMAAEWSATRDRAAARAEAEAAMPRRVQAFGAAFQSIVLGAID